MLQEGRELGREEDGLGKLQKGKEELIWEEGERGGWHEEQLSLNRILLIIWACITAVFKDHRGG